MSDSQDKNYISFEKTEIGQIVSEAPAEKYVSFQKKYFNRLTIIGDSITQKGFTPGGYCAELMNFYQRRLRVDVWGFSGYTSRHVLRYLPEIPLEIDSTKLLIVFLGTNDCQLTETGYMCPVDEFKNNLLALTRPFPHSKIIIVSPGICTKDICFKREQEPYVIAASETVNTLNKSKANSAGLINLYEITKSYPTPELLFTDGLHFSSLGYSLLFNEIVATISKAWPELLPNNLPLQFPHWSEILFT
ncbi:isoamyl acetate hydrolytic enzyme Iah1 [Schizosaccharomyces pombe]|uniref:Isoamyl acetate-hydrolyzing esterase n=1 Tax=Schizosaccharomyces pombe (strain 972 / ATCC 24843) TaxID=284812 RepID=IAH1_SCHPO|nr:putative isoamyl acetate hydrolytic enzyme Iah1 [Schizosaccharomyces pombe]O74648.1 RecName: Full=Isoamyl acetate-hydrolyzing esterase [Schizosaccharomyces pombe 972h-]BAA33369.1 isoamyl acetate hydrolytic enzyme homolog [Schizosaccharomyces pombe]CAA22479.1 isoamyl acetate hydrolytic enzyme Iah1 (predicted) [Schizosaccharomyces pombe]|eukprot:NP_588453.1 putative isoamyl acetate hydrolytic enzyme Iah1 [Schizosaccharomyces pombe]